MVLGGTNTSWSIMLLQALLVLVQRRHGINLHPEDVFLDIVWESLHLIRSVNVCRDSED